MDVSDNPLKNLSVQEVVDIILELEKKYSNENETNQLITQEQIQKLVEGINFEEDIENQSSEILDLLKGIDFEEELIIKSPQKKKKENHNDIPNFEIGLEDLSDSEEEEKQVPVIQPFQNYEVKSPKYYELSFDSDLGEVCTIQGQEPVIQPFQSDEIKSPQSSELNFPLTYDMIMSTLQKVIY